MQDRLQPKLHGMDAVRREDFDIKLQMFYSNERSDSSHGHNHTLNDSQDVASLIQGHSMDVLMQKEGNSSGNHRIADLESELIELRAKKHADTSAFAIDRRPNTALTASKGLVAAKIDSQIEENRKREKQATQAIAAHDGILIHRLEAEVVRLLSQHETDLRLIRDSTKRVTELISEKELLHLKSVEQVATARRLEIQIQILTDHVQRGQMILENERNAHSLSHESVLATNEALKRELKTLAANHRKLGQRPLINSPRFEESGKPSLGKSQSLRKEKLSHSSLNNNLKSCTSSKKDCNSAIRYPKNNDLGHENKRYDENLDKNYHENYHEKYDLWSTENHLRAENSKLLKYIENDRELLRRQEKALNQVRTSAEEITLLEAEEIVRLETELDRCTELKNEWEKKCNNALSHIKQLLVQQSSSTK